jgi:hypothetical protein
MIQIMKKCLIIIMNNFNFSGLSETSFTNNGPQYLRPYDIYEVNLTKAEKSSLKGKDGTEYGVIALEFKGCGDSNGVYTHNLFIPNKDSDFERRINETSGTPYPSAFEQFQYTLMQLVQVINPKGAEKIKENASKLKSMDQFIDLIIKALTGKADVKFFLKLVGRNQGGTTYATIPNACVLSKKATAETKPSPLNFVSTDKSLLAFSNYELTQMKNYKNATPTNMDKEAGENPDTAGDDVDLDDISLD